MLWAASGGNRCPSREVESGAVVFVGELPNKCLSHEEMGRKRKADLVGWGIHRTFAASRNTPRHGLPHLGGLYKS